MRKNLPSIDLMRLAEYDPMTGVFAKQYQCVTTGYVYVSIGGQSLQAHRVVLALKTGQWPINQVDHINCNRADNRPENLRECTNTQNMQNSRVTIKSKSGIKGVHWCKDRNKWGAWICVNKKRIGLGRFLFKDDAVRAYKLAAEKYFGEFARVA